MYVKIIVISLLAVVLQHLMKIIYRMDFHRTIYNHHPGQCRLVPGVDFGSEDMETLSNGLTFITSGLLMPTASALTKEFHKTNKVKGKIFLFDFNNPDKNVAELKIVGDLNQSDFHPHGISSWQDENTGRVIIYVVNHRSMLDTIEKFEYKVDTRELHHKHTYKDPAIHYANDVVAVEEEKFYFSNFAQYRTRAGVIMENTLMLPFANLMYYDGKKYSIAAEGFLLANGLAISLNKKYVYLCTGTKDMKIFEREKSGVLLLWQELPLYTQPDNPVVDKATGNILIGSHPVGYKIVEHMEDPSKPAPSQVLMLHMDKQGSNVTWITELFSDDGHTLYGSSAASLYNKQMLIGTVFHKLMFCDVKSI